MVYLTESQCYLLLPDSTVENLAFITTHNMIYRRCWWTIVYVECQILNFQFVGLHNKALNWKGPWLPGEMWGHQET